MRKNSIYVLLMPLLLIACLDEVMTTNEATCQKISFSIGFSNEIKIRLSTDEMFKTTFDEGDSIGIFIYKRAEEENSSIESNLLYVDNRKMTYNGNSWILESPIYYADDGSLLDIYAYYPYQEGAIAGALSYNAVSGMTDLLAASILGVRKEDKIISLMFGHLLSLIHISIDKTETVPDFDETFYAYFHGAISGGYNLETKEINDPEKGVIEMALVGPADMLQRTYRAWVPAQQIISGTIFSFLQTSFGKEFSLSREAIEPIDLTRGWAYQSQITLDKQIEKDIEYQLYDPYPKYGSPIGIVVKITLGGRGGIVMSLRDLGSAQWSTGNWVTGATYVNDGISNKMKIQSRPDWENDHPAFKLCVSLGERWYLPALEEAYAFLYEDIGNINWHLASISGSQPIDRAISYFTSTESSASTVRKVYTGNGVTVDMGKTEYGRIRAFYEF